MKMMHDILTDGEMKGKGASVICLRTAVIHQSHLYHAKLKVSSKNRLILCFEIADPNL